MLGCSSAPDTIAEPAPNGVHLSNVISQLTRPQLTIAKLSPDYVNETIQVTGRVQQHVPLLEGTLYLIEDGTGQVWVFSLEAPPAIGDRAQVSGILQYEPIVVSGADMGEYYLQEQSRSQLNRSEATP